MNANKKKALGRGLGALLTNPETDVTSKNDLYGKFVVGAISTIPISQIEAKAVRKLQQPSRSQELVGFLD